MLLQKSPLVTCATYKSVANMFLRLKCSESWRGKIPTQEGFSKEDKEAFNLLIFSIFKEIMLDGDEDMSGFPAYVIKRLYKKAYTWDSKPANKAYFHAEIPQFEQKIEEYILGMMREQGNGEFAEFIDSEARKVSEKVLKVYKAARIMASVLEHEEMSEKLRADTIEETRQQIRRDIWAYSDLPHFIEIVDGVGKYRNLKTLMKSMSSSRYIFRWQGYISPVRCSILSHMLESAILCYLMNMEVKPEEHDAVKDFWVLMFHDLSEVWTDDIPSPVKDGVKFIRPGPQFSEMLKEKELTLRQIAEAQELSALEEHFYSSLPEESRNFFNNGVMLEDVEDKELKRWYKAADYFSADLEVYWNIKGGAHESRFRDILQESLDGGNRTFAQRQWLSEVLSQCKGIVFLD